MADLNTHSSRMILIIQCRVKSAEEFKNGLGIVQQNMFMT